MPISIAPDTFTRELRKFLLSHVIIQCPSYIAYCRQIVGNIVRLWDGPLVRGTGQLQWKCHGRSNNSQQQQQPGRDIHLRQQPFESTTYQVWGFDGLTGTHLLKCIPSPPMKEEKLCGIPEVSPEGYVQVVLAECTYQYLVPGATSKYCPFSNPLSSPHVDVGTDCSSVGKVKKMQVRPVRLIYTIQTCVSTSLSCAVVRRKIRLGV